jgi:putative ABC transport system substrate-binding protein
MDRRCFLLTLVAGALAAPLVGRAQQTRRVPRIAVIGPLSPPPAPSPDVEALRQGLRALGYVEGENLIIEYRWAAGRLDRMAELTAEAVGLSPDVIVVSGASWAVAARKATSTIPIVMTTGGSDPVASGVAASLARPGGNVTGHTMMTSDVSVKRVELLKDTVTGVSRIAICVPPRAPRGVGLLVSQMEEAARVVGLQTHTAYVKSSADLEGAFREAVRERAGAAILVQSPFFANELARTVDLALKYRMPTMAGEPGYAEAGGLMSYGPSIPELWRQAATYVDKILKGAKPADLPIQQPTKFDLVINLKTAKALGLTIPPSLLARADQVIE